MFFPFNLEVYLKHPERFAVQYRYTNDELIFASKWIERLEWSEEYKEVMVLLSDKFFIMTKSVAEDKLWMFLKNAVKCTRDHFIKRGPNCGFKILYCDASLEVSSVLNIGTTNVKVLLNDGKLAIDQFSNFLVIPYSNVNDVDECLNNKSDCGRINVQVIDGQVEVIVPFGTVVNINYV